MVWKSPSGKLLYRVGDVLISTNTQNPSEWFGGSWQLLCPGKTLVCIDSNDADFNIIEKTGGEKVHTLSLSEIPNHSHDASSGSAGDHSHSASTGSAGNHNHTLYLKDDIKGGVGSAMRVMTKASHNDSTASAIEYAGAHTHSVSINNAGSHSHSISVSASGGSSSHNNLQPFMVVYIWVRIA